MGIKVRTNRAAYYNDILVFLSRVFGVIVELIFFILTLMGKDMRLLNTKLFLDVCFRER